MNETHTRRIDRLEHALTTALAPVHLSLENESHQHAGQRQESHFRVVIVSAAFSEMPLLARHRLVNAAIAAERHTGLHALALHTYTPAEWQQRGAAAPQSPACAGAHG